MSGLVYAYDLSPDASGSQRHIWSAVGARGGVHIWAVRLADDAAAIWGDWYIGGVECHWREPQYGEHRPSHNDCWLIGGPCWHDGSSLYFSENIEPMLRGIDGTAVPESIHAYVNSELLDWYRVKIDRQEEASK